MHKWISGVILLLAVAIGCSSSVPVSTVERQVERIEAAEQDPWIQAGAAVDPTVAAALEELKNLKVALQQEISEAKSQGLSEIPWSDITAVLVAIGGSMLGVPIIVNKQRDKARMRRGESVS